MTTLASSAPVRGREGAWRPALVSLFMLTVVVLMTYRHSFESMVETWSRSEAYAHGFLVAPISLWLAWRLRARVRLLVPRPSAWIALPLAAVASIWQLADMAGINSVAQLAATSMLMLIVPLVLGVTIGRALAFPLLYLFFMVPIGDFLIPQMMTWTADVTVGALRLLGVPVYREGLQFVVPTGTWSVIEACSGVRYLVASVMVGALFAHLNYSSLRRQAAFVVVAIAMALVANWLRAILLVMAGHLSNNTIGAGADHFVYGWVVYGVVIFVIFWVGSRWADRASIEAPGGQRAAVDGVAAVPRVPIWVLAVVLACAALTAPAMLASRNEDQANSPVDLRMPSLGTEARAVPTHFPQPEFQGATAQAWAAYRASTGPVVVHIAYFRRQEYGRKLVSSQNSLARPTSREWAVVSTGQQSLTIEGKEVVLRSAEMRGGMLGAESRALRMQVRQVFWVDRRLVVDDRLAVLLGLWGQLAGRGADAAVVTFYAEVAEPAVEAAAGTDGTEHRADSLDAFVTRNLPAVVAELERQPVQH